MTFCQRAVRRATVALMPAVASASGGRRPRHDPRETEREILLAAEALLRERPFRDITVEQLMLRTGLKRPAFYAHFRDRYELVLRVVESIELKLFEQADPWLRSDGPGQARAAIAGVVQVYESHGLVLRALADASASDARLEVTYRGLVQAFVDATAAKIRADQQVGLVSASLQAVETGRALVWLAERYLSEVFGSGDAADAQLTVAVLHRIWVSAIYGDSVAA